MLLAGRGRLRLFRSRRAGGLHLGVVDIDVNRLRAGERRHHLRVNREDRLAILPGHEASLWGQESQVASCGSHSAGRR